MRYASNVHPAPAFPTNCTSPRTYTSQPVRSLLAMPVAPSSDASLLLKIHEFRRGTVHSGEFYNADPRSSALSIPDSRATSSSRRYTFDWSDAVTIGAPNPMLPHSMLTRKKADSWTRLFAAIVTTWRASAVSL